ncbi:MAG: hypothetical protein IT159_04030 [Bryobacterales bacterium]|nr:hypothetical protein [Bryobacterales bacterium]
MRIRCGAAAIGVLLWGTLLAAPPLTSISDVLYRADGSRFNGVAFIEWKSFQAVDLSTIATHSVTVPIQDGALLVRLVPTTNAATGAYYSVRYHSDGRIQFSEVWAVPPSATPLKLRDVRVQGSVYGGAVLPPAGDTEILISDVTGLAEELEARPLKGPGYAPSRAAFISGEGTLEGVPGDLSDCVRVDGTSAPCNLPAAEVPGFVDAETPSGSINGSNRLFTLSEQPSPPQSLLLFRNGVLQRQGLDYTLSGGVITFATAATPQVGDLLTASYRLSESGGPGAEAGVTYPRPQVLCGGTGAGTSSAAWTSLGACMIPAGTLAAGDRVAVSFSFTHEGSAVAPSIELRWGATAVLSRTGANFETLLAGTGDFGAYEGNATWAVQSWGATLALAAGAGVWNGSLASPLTVDFRGRLASASAETITLRNYSVVRYPARTSP